MCILTALHRLYPHFTDEGNQAEKSSSRSTQPAHNMVPWYLSSLSVAPRETSLNGFSSPSAKIAFLPLGRYSSHLPFSLVFHQIFLIFTFAYQENTFYKTSQKGLMTYSLLAMHSGSKVAWGLTRLTHVCFWISPLPLRGREIFPWVWLCLDWDWINLQALIPLPRKVSKKKKRHRKSYCVSKVLTALAALDF